MINNSDTTGKKIWFPFPFVRTEAYGARLQPATGIGYRYYFGKASDFNGPLTDFKASKCFRAKKVKMSGKRKHVVSQKESYIAKRNGKNFIIEHRGKKNNSSTDNKQNNTISLWYQNEAVRDSNPRVRKLASTKSCGLGTVQDDLLNEVTLSIFVIT